MPPSLEHNYVASRQLAGAFFLIIVMVTNPANAKPLADWSPKASEQLIKLPGDFVKKAVDNDFARSQLAAELIQLDKDISLKQQTLADLHNAVQQSDGDLRLELQHQFLAEKHNYIDLVTEQQNLRGRRARTKVRLYERLLAKLKHSERVLTPKQAELLSKQKSARKRFEASAVRIDTKLLVSSTTSESKYAREYARNLAAIDTLVQAVKSHPMNRAPEISGVAVTRAEYLRQLIAENQAEVAVVSQERAILGYMAKLVSLDALALSEGIATPLEPGTIAPDATEPGFNRAIEFFVSQNHRN
jgi:hypothetical protein